VKIICDRYITISFQKKILNTVRHKNIVTAAVILVIALASFLLPIAAYSQLPYLLNTQLPEKNQGNQGRIMMLTDNVSNNSIVSIPRNAIGSSSKNNNNKVVIINFDDSHKSQYTYAKPTLDKYGFKATFFEVCNWIGTGHKSDMTMTWHDIAALHRDGMDIESYTMTHAHLNTLSAAALNYGIGGSKQCFLNHGYNTTIFGYPVKSGSNMSSVVNIVAKYYSLARTGSDSLMYLHCNGYKEDSHQTDCRTYSADGKLTYANRYDIRSKSFDHISNSYIAYTPTQLFQQFVQRVNSQLQYNNNNINKDGTINAVPLIVYHNLTIATKFTMNYLLPLLSPCLLQK
jgi:hypothetical protein